MPCSRTEWHFTDVTARYPQPLRNTCREPSSDKENSACSSAEIGLPERFSRGQRFFPLPASRDLPKKSRSGNEVAAESAKKTRKQGSPLQTVVQKEQKRKGGASASEGGFSWLCFNKIGAFLLPFDIVARGGTTGLSRQKPQQA
ncbi:hypothetical protein MRX96_010889 [Rhipicephalus microplus]